MDFVPPDALIHVLNHYWLTQFGELTAEEFYGPAGVCRATRAWFRTLLRERATFARTCPPWDVGDARWRGLLKTILDRLARFVPSACKVINLRGCVVPNTRELLRKEYRFIDRGVTLLLLGAVRGDTSLLFGLQQPPVPAWSQYRFARNYFFLPPQPPPPPPPRPLPAHYHARRPPCSACGYSSTESEEEKEEVEEERPPVPPAAYARCFYNGNVVIAPPSWAVATGDASPRELYFDMIRLREVDVESTFYHERIYDTPAPPAHLSALKTVVVDNLMPQNFNEVGKTKAALAFVAGLLDLNPQLERLAIIASDSGPQMLLVMNPLTDEQVEHNARGGSFLYSAGFGGDRHAHADIVRLWGRLLAWKRDGAARRLSVLYTSHGAAHRSPCRALYKEYGTPAWPLQYHTAFMYPRRQE